MPRVATKSVVVPIERATRRAITKQVNAAICQLQLADEFVHDEEPAQARVHFKAAQEAIAEGARLLKGL